MNNLDEVTLSYIATALWQTKFESNKLTDTQKQQIFSDKNSSASISNRLKSYVLWLKDNQQSFNPDYNKHYDILAEYCDDINPQQAYIIASKFLGLNATLGYDQMPKTADLKFPRDHEPKLRSQVGWHFFVGSAWDKNGQEYGIELMFFGVALTPPNLAEQNGINDIENQIYEIQLGISKAGDRHHQAEPIVISGTSGLINFDSDPFSFSVGKNYIKSLKKDSFFPLKIEAWGLDKEDGNSFELGINLDFSSGKETLLQGDDGCMPCVDGMGTLYYSIPNLVLEPGSTIKYGDQTIILDKGSFWFDHQWGFLAGNPQSPVLRAANNIKPPGPSGWDWYMAQFNGNRQLTMFAEHSAAYSEYYYQTGDKSPGTMVIDVVGKYMDENKQLHNTWGTLTIDKWFKSEQTPNNTLYPVTHTWHPSHWKFSFDKTMPEDIRQFSMNQIVPTAQTNFFANGSQYNEGAVYIVNNDGKDIGRGFAEAVQYANTKSNCYKLAGITNIDDQKILNKDSDNLFGRGKSLCYTLLKSKELKNVLSTAKGLEFFSKPNETK